jgi:hypothetical protein
MKLQVSRNRVTRLCLDSLSKMKPCTRRVPKIGKKTPESFMCKILTIK